MKTLDEIALQYDADKSSKYHGYTRIYEELFAPLREKTVSILEIGVFQGASIRMWLDAFPLAKVVGVDIKDRAAPEVHRLPRASLHLADASLQKTIDSLVKLHGPFDIVIDDGPHRLSVSKMCLDNLPVLLKPGGIMVIEDVYQGYSNQHNHDLVEFMAYATMVAHGGGTVKGVVQGNWHMATDLAKEIDGIEMRRGLVIARRVPR